jgi:zinc protease
MRTKRCAQILLLLLLVAAVSMAVAQMHPRELQEPPPITFTPPKPVEFTLSNGIHVFYLEDREVPLVSLSGRMRGGSLYEPAEKAGLANMTATVMRSGGTAKLSGDAIDEELEMLAASVDVGMGGEFGRGSDAGMGGEFINVSASCLKKDVKRVFEILAAVMTEPAFPQEKIDLAKNQAKEAIRRRWDRPASASGIVFSEEMLSGTPYGQRTSFRTLNNISRDDLVAFHGRFFAPGNVYLGVTGDISRDEARTLLEGVFKGWKKRDVAIPEIPPLKERADGTVYYAFKETPQASVVMGHLGVRRNNPDQYRLEVMNDIFGGRGFTARLMKEIRSNRGLTYGIYGGVNEGKDRGMFQIASQLKAERCVEALSLVRDMITEMQTTPVPDEELSVSKNSIINSFVFQFESKDRIPGMYISRKLSGYPDNYFEQYISNIKKITKEDVQEVARKYMDPAKLIIVVVGDEKKFDKPLSTLGKVQPVDIKKMAVDDKAE